MMHASPSTCIHPAVLDPWSADTRPIELEGNRCHVVRRDRSHLGSCDATRHAHDGAAAGERLRASGCGRAHAASHHTYCSNSLLRLLYNGCACVCVWSFRDCS
jgi:hypothetical protein